MFEVLLYREAQAAVVPHTTEPSLERGEIFDSHRGIEGAAEGTTNKRCRGFGGDFKGQIHRRKFGDRNAVVNHI
jgi:hypothetical protein